MSKYTDVYNHKKEEEEKPEGLTKVQRGFITLSVIGAGIGIFGFVKGQQFGYKRGFRNGELFANDQFRELANELIALRESKKEE
jgi:hypothetical protein